MEVQEDIRGFTRKKTEAENKARQTVAVFLLTGIDMGNVLEVSSQERNRIMIRLKRLMERERQKGMYCHWGYDLNRHIALKQALDWLKSFQNHEKAHR